MLNGFKEYISKKGSVKAQYIPFYLKWVAACYSFLGVSDSTRIDNDRKKTVFEPYGKDSRGLAGKAGRHSTAALSIFSVTVRERNQALNPLLFLFRHVLEKDIAGELSAVRARQRRRLPVVLTAKEIQGVFDHMSGTPKLMAMIIYGCRSV